MSGWKVFALFNVLFTSFSLRYLDSYGPAETVNFALEVLSAIGLVLMAFQLNVIPRVVWRVLAVVWFAHCSLAVIAWGLNGPYALDGGLLEGLLLYVLYHFAVGYGLWLSGTHRDRHADVRPVTA